jgi:hypothetical protein
MHPFWMSVEPKADAASNERNKDFASNGLIFMGKRKIKKVSYYI